MSYGDVRTIWVSFLLPKNLYETNHKTATQKAKNQKTHITLPRKRKPQSTSETTRAHKTARKIAKPLRKIWKPQNRKPLTAPLGREQNLSAYTMGSRVGGEKFLDGKKWRGKDFFWRKNDGADTFLGKKTTELGLFYRKRMTGRRLFTEWIRTVLIKSIENIPLQAYFSGL